MRCTYVISDELINYLQQMLPPPFSMLKMPKIVKIAMDLIRLLNLSRCINIIKPRSVSLEELSIFHSRSYMSKLIGKSSKISTSHLPPANPEAVKLIIGATLTAIDIALKNNNIAVNPLGGFVDSPRDAPGPLSYINDVATAIAYTRGYQKIRKVAVINLSTWDFGEVIRDKEFLNDPSILFIDIHLEPLHNPYSSLFSLYPNIENLHEDIRNLRIVFRVLPTFTDSEFELVKREIVMKSIERFDPELIIMVLHGYFSIFRPIVSQPLISPQILANLVCDIAEQRNGRVVVLGQGGPSGPLSLLMLMNIAKRLCRTMISDDEIRGLIHKYLELDKDLREWIALLELVRRFMSLGISKIDKVTRDYVTQELEKLRKRCRILM